MPTSRHGTSPTLHPQGLPGLGPASVAMLAHAGVHTLADLQALGSVAAFARVRASGRSPSLNLLWALEGALSGLPWQTVAREHRTSLLLALDHLGTVDSAPSDTPTIERLHPPHAADYRALMLEAYATAPEAFSSSPVDREDLPLDWWATRLDDTRSPGLVWGAWLGDQLVGSVALDWTQQIKTRHKGHLYGVYVQPAWRGLGLARALLIAALAPEALPPHLASVCLTVTEGNAPAQRLYASLGFVTWGTEPDALRMPDGRRLAKVHMRWERR